MPSLSEIPFLSQYRAREAQIRGEGLDELKQFSTLAQLQAQLQATQEKQRAFQKEQEYRAAVSAIGPNPTQEQLVSVGSMYAGPEKNLDIHQKSLDRAATREATQATAAERVAANREAAAARIEQQAQQATMLHEVRLSRIQNDQARAAETARHNQAMERLSGQIAAIRASGANTSKPPSGYRITADNNLEAIPGGPADLKQQGMFNQDTAALSSTESSLDRLATAANEVMRHPGLGRITGLLGAVPNIPGSAASDAAAKLQTLKAQVGFGVLQDMRNASKTGGALGQITERELAFLQNALAALENSQSEDQMKDSLQKIIEFSAGSKARLRGAFNVKHGGRPQAAPATNEPAPTPAAPKPRRKFDAQGNEIK